jgi:uncharacterized repeat protein (TIGR01451 family)
LSHKEDISNVLKRFLMKNLILILTILGVQTVAFGQGWQRIFSEHFEVKTACKDYDGGYLLAGATSAFTLVPPPYVLMKVDANGNLRWTKSFEDVKTSTGLNRSINVIQAADSSFLLYGKTDYASIFALKKLDARGNVLWTKKLPLQGVVLKSDRTGYTLTGYNSRSDSSFLLKLNQNGDTISHKLLTFEAPYDFELQNNDLVCLKRGSGDIYKMNLNGQVIWTKNVSPFSFQSPMKLIPAKDSNFYINGTDYNVLKINKNADTIWKKPLTQSLNVYSQFYNSNDNGLLSSPSNANNPTNTLSMSRFDRNGGKIWTRTFSYLKRITVADVISCDNGGYLAVGNYDPDNYGTLTLGAIFLMKMDENGVVYSNNLEGKIIKDVNKNCQFDATDTPFKACIVEAKNSLGDTFWGLSDSTGRYAINIDSGAFTVKAYPLNNRNLWESCTPSVAKTLSSARRTDTLDFALKAIIDCPAMDVNISTPTLRRCFNNIYAVKYCNKGTIVANNAYATVTLDSLLEFINASKPIASITGRTYRFNLGNVAADDCGNFNITTRVRCGDSTRLGQSLCVEAKIYPDSVCPPPTLWSGANISVTGSCQGDSVLFQIKNTGTAPSSTLKSIVIEDQVLFLTEPFMLPQNGIINKKFPANGHTWRVVANQEPNHPTSTNPTAFVEGCRANNTLPISTGFAVLFPNDDRAATIDMDCRQILGSYDPNDKTGFPIGYKSANYIGQNQDIEYMIRFQNTGTDTAFTVMIRDTISNKLDISSIEFGASSHPYEAEIYGKGILKFTFNNIKLVDSFRNEPKSRGFVQYRIKQQKDLAFGSQIFNTAHIYFDYNEPIVTNKTLHTVGGKEIITAIFDKIQTNNYTFKVSPNPFLTSAIFEGPLSINGNFELFDLSGKLLRTEKFNGKTFEFQRRDLLAGMYIFKIRTKEGPLSIGKLFVQ